MPEVKDVAHEHIQGDEQAHRSEMFLRTLVANGYVLGDPSFHTEGLLEALLLTVVDQANRLAVLETALEAALETAYRNYDPIVGQLSEVRREIARMRTERQTALADRDRLWCETLRTVDWGANDGPRYVQATLAKFAELCQKGDLPSW